MGLIAIGLLFPTEGDALVFNGEIYGYRALGDDLRKLGARFRDRSDTEVLFQLIRAGLLSEDQFTAREEVGIERLRALLEARQRVTQNV